MTVPQDPRVTVVCGMRRRQFSVSQAVAKAVFEYKCKLTVNQGGLLTLMMGEGPALVELV